MLVVTTPFVACIELELIIEEVEVNPLIMEVIVLIPSVVRLF